MYPVTITSLKPLERIVATKTRKPMSDEKRAELAEKRQAEASELHRAIANRVKELATGDAWIAHLKFMQSFHKYSFNNTVLMMVDRYAAGKPMPTMVAGYQQWLEKGYQVRKGERGMRIFGFSKKIVRDPKTGEPVIGDDGKPKYRVMFPIVSVFDVAQVDPVTESFVDRKGRTIPVAQPLDAHQPVRLVGDDTLGLRDKVAKYVHDYGWTFSAEPINIDGTNGYTTLDGSRRVVVDSGNEPAQQAKTALHEAAHMLMHATKDGKPANDGRSRADHELEAESVAYVVGAMLGLDTEQYSDKYLLHWSAGNPEAIKATAGRVQKAVKELYAALGDEEEV
jgi:antirestriction protein ArdC